MWPKVMCLVVTLMAVDSAKNKEFVSSDMPPQSGDDPLEVTTSLFFDDISTFNDRLMQYNIDYYLRHKWIVEADKCAIYGKMLARTKTNTSKTQSDEIVMNSGQVCKIFWCPDTFLVEGKFTRMPSRITSMKVLILHMDDSDGTCLMEYYVKLSTVVSCPMNFRKYPADVQTCVMTFRSFSYGEDMLELHWAPKEIEPIRIDPGMKLHQHRVGFRYTEAVVQRDSVNLSALVVNFMFKRQMSNTLIRTYSPSAMVVILSWFSFWMALDAIPARVTLCVTSLLALVTQFANEQEDLPAVSYVNGAEIWMFTCISFVGGAILEFSIVKYIHYIKEKQYEELIKTQNADFQEGDLDLPPGIVFWADQPVKRRRLPVPPAHYQVLTSHNFRYKVTELPLIRQRFTAKDSNDWIKTKRINLKTRKTLMREHSNAKRKDIPNTVDYYSRILFPVTFIVFNAIYWPVLIYS